MKFHTSGLAVNQMEALRQIGKTVTTQGYYLAGGTALAIYYGHRRSVDLDWFTLQSLSDPLNFAQKLRDEGVPFETNSTERGTLYGLVNTVRTSFIEYRYALLQPLVTWDDGQCQLAGLDDLACMKLSAIAQRGRAKILSISLC